MAKENALSANKKNWDIDPSGSAPAAPKAPPAPPAPSAPPAPKAPPAPAAPSGGIGGGLFDRIKAVLEPTDVGGGKSAASKPKEEAIYEDDEMYGGFGSPAPPRGLGTSRFPSGQHLTKKTARIRSRRAGVAHSRGSVWCLAGLQY